MLKLICFLYIICFYITGVIIFFKHFHYLVTLFKKKRKLRINKKSSSVYRCVQSVVAPVYRKEYFGYEYIILTQYDNTILEIHKYFRVYGTIRNNTDCLLLYKGNVVKTVICLGDTEYSSSVLEDFRIIYKWMLITLTGGVLIWLTCSQYIIY